VTAPRWRSVDPSLRWYERPGEPEVVRSALSSSVHLVTSSVRPFEARPPRRGPRGSSCWRFNMNAADAQATVESLDSPTSSNQCRDATFEEAGVAARLHGQAWPCRGSVVGQIDRRLTRLAHCGRTTPSSGARPGRLPPRRRVQPTSGCASSCAGRLFSWRRPDALICCPGGGARASRVEPTGAWAVAYTAWLLCIRRSSRGGRAVLLPAQPEAARAPLRRAA
jgi:hypothetical protein